jgi:hypothetical protein
VITYVIAREKQGEQLGGGAIADGETDANNASVDSPLTRFSRIADGTTDAKSAHGNDPLHGELACLRQY